MSQQHVTWKITKTRTAWGATGMDAFHSTELGCRNLATAKWNQGNNTHTLPLERVSGSLGTWTSWASVQVPSCAGAYQKVNKRSVGILHWHPATSTAQALSPSIWKNLQELCKKTLCLVAMDTEFQRERGLHQRHGLQLRLELWSLTTNSRTVKIMVHQKSHLTSDLG